MTKKWTIDEIGSLDNKVSVVTGGNSGLGYESVKVLTSKGAKVILASRSVERGEEAKKEILKLNPDSDIEVMALDLSSLESVTEFAKAFSAKYTQLDILLNNAGIMMTPYGLTKDGLEQQIGVNHFGHYALTGQLFGVIKKTPGARIVNISSLAHRNGVMDFDNILFDEGKDYTPMKAYGQSKLANLLFTYELQRKVDEHNLDMIVLAAHPGVSNTNLARHMAGKWWFKLIKPLFALMTQSAFKGALPGLRASVDQDAKGANYYGPDKRNEMVGNPILVTSNEASHSLQDAKQLWSVSEKLTQIEYNFDKEA